MKLHVANDPAALYQQAALQIASTISETIAVKAQCRFAVATDISAVALWKELSTLSIDWQRVILFQMSDYVGKDSTVLRQQFADMLKLLNGEPLQVRLLDPTRCDDFASQLLLDDIDIVCFGVGSSGQIVFNFAEVATCADEQLVKVVRLEDSHREQLVSNGQCSSLEEAPTHVATWTIPAILRAQHVVVVVAEQEKESVVSKMLYGALTEECPASLLRSHDNCLLWLSKTVVPQPELSIPGLIDLQVNGYHGIDFTSRDLTLADVEHACTELFATGVAAFLPTVVTAPPEVYEHVLPIVWFVIVYSNERSLQK